MAVDTHGTLIGGRERESGGVAIAVAIGLLTLVSFSALAVDIGYLFMTRNELQNIADAAALAAARKLGGIYKTSDGYNAATDRPLIVSVAQDVSQRNWAGGKSEITINQDEVQIGIWDGNGFAVTADAPNAARIIARRDGAANGPVSTFFAKIFGIDSVEVSATAVAALSAQSSAQALAPFGISNAFFAASYCDQPINIKFTEDLDDCAGWHTFDEWPASPASALEGIVNGMRDGSFEFPEIKMGDELVFTGLPVLSVFDEMQALYEQKKDENGTWKVNVVVYENEGYGCGTPSPFPDPLTAKTIVGFATIVIEGVLRDPDEYNQHTVRARVVCNSAEQGRGGGFLPGTEMYFGTVGNIPNLVK